MIVRLGLLGLLLAGQGETQAPPGGAASPVPAPRSEAPNKTEVRLSLQEAIQWAVMKNLNLVVEELNRDIIARDLVIARATFDPFFNVSSLYQKNREPSANLIDFDPLTGAPGGVGVRVNPSEVTSVRGGVGGLSPIGTTYQLSLVGSRFDSPEAGIFTLNPRYSTRAEITAVQPLLKGAWYAYNTAGVRVARANIELSREQLELAAINTIFAVESAYWELVFALKNHDSKLRALEVAREQLRIDQRKFEVGTKARIDVTTSEAQVARRQTELDQAESLMADARDQLLDRMNYVGLEESLRSRWERRDRSDSYGQYGDLLVVPTTEPRSDPVAVDRSEAIRTAFESRAEFHQMNLRIRNQETAVEVARNQLLPALDLNAGWFQLGLDKSLHDSADRLTNGDYYNWLVGATFEIPLTLRGPRANYRNARDLHQRLKVEKQSLENAIVLEVDKAIRDVEYAHRAVENLRQQVVLQEELLRAERVKLDVGKSIAYTVAQIENDLIAIQAQELRAKADYEIAKTSFDRAVGQLLRRRGVDLGR